MKTPTIDVAQELIKQVIERRAEHDNNFLREEWLEHINFVAQSAKIIAKMAPDLNPDDAYILGLLHDFGKKYDEKTENVFHGLEGYKELKKLGFDDAARINLTHTFLLKPSNEIQYPFNKAAVEECRLLINKIDYDDYDRLIQLCDWLNDRGRNCTIRARMSSLQARYNVVNEDLVKIGNEAQKLKEYFDKKCSCSVYRLIGLD